MAQCALSPDCKPLRGFENSAIGAVYKFDPNRTVFNYI
jgi:hypothetical protein